MVESIRLVMKEQGAVTSDGNTKNYHVGNFKDAIFVLDVTTVSGTSPTLDVTIEAVYLITDTYGKVVAERTDTIATFPQMTTTGTKIIYNLDVEGLRTANTTNQVVLKKLPMFIRAKWVLGGTSPNFNFSVIAELKE